MLNMALEKLTIGALRQERKDNYRQVKAVMPAQEHRIEILENLLMKAWTLLFDAGLGESFRKGLTKAEHETLQRLEKRQDPDDITNAAPETPLRCACTTSPVEENCQTALDQQNKGGGTTKTMTLLPSPTSVSHVLSCASRTNSHSPVFDTLHVPVVPDPRTSQRDTLVPLKKRGIMSTSSVEKTSCLTVNNCGLHTGEGNNSSGSSCPVDGLSTLGSPKLIPTSSASPQETAVSSVNGDTSAHEEESQNLTATSGTHSSEANSSEAIAHKVICPSPHLSYSSSELSSRDMCETSPVGQVLKGNKHSVDTSFVISTSKMESTIICSSIEEGTVSGHLKESDTSIMISDDLDHFSVVQEETIGVISETEQVDDEETFISSCNITVQKGKIPEPTNRLPKQKTHRLPLVKDNLCGECGKTFTSKQNLRHHVKVIHESEVTYECTVCLRSFRHTHNLAIHKRTQNHYSSEEQHWMQPITFYTCKLCHKAFQRECNLEAHFRLHTGARPFKCSHCDRRFAQSSNCKKHELIHTQQRPFACEDCGATFTSSSNLQRHQRSAHGGSTGHLCPFCGKKFSQTWNLKRHEQKQHSH